MPFCGYAEIQADNIYNTRINAHFHCGHNIANDAQLQLALRSIEGLDMNTLSYMEKEHVAKAIENGYLYREGECPDAVFLDINMPKLDGVNALQQMTEINDKASIIMLSAVDSQDVIDKCKGLGAADYILKPFGMEQLMQALHTALCDE